MFTGFLWRSFFCVFVFSFCLYLYIDRQNKLTELRLQIPVKQKELERIEQENTLLTYQLDKFENPIHLMELAGKPEFAHLKHPLVKDIWIFPEKHENAP